METLEDGDIRILGAGTACHPARRVSKLLDVHARIAAERARNRESGRIEIVVDTPIVHHHLLANYTIGDIECIKNRRHYVGADIRREAAAQRYDSIHLPFACDFAERAMRKPALPRTERQL